VLHGWPHYALFCSGGNVLIFLCSNNSFCPNRLYHSHQDRFDHARLVNIHTKEFGAKYDVLRSLSTGVQGSTQLVRRRKTGQEFVAKKAVNAQQVCMDSFTEEFEKMRALRHPHCAKVFELVRNQEIVEGFPHQQLFIITEYARGGDLVQYMQTATLHGGLSEEIVAKMFQQAMEGVAYVTHAKQLTMT